MTLEQRVYEVKGNQFPFGVFNVQQYEIKKIFVRKRYCYRNLEEYDDLRNKIEKLKILTHKNAINLRSTQEKNSSIDLFYQYVPYSLEDSFTENTEQTVKEIHRQFIELAIHLAKNCIQTTFNSKRCGVVINENKSIIKYYLPLNQITITNDRAVLERSVQMFNVQSMHFLDTLVMHSHNETINQNSSHRSLKNIVKLFQNNRIQKDRRPSGVCNSPSRKLSHYPNAQSQIRKLSTLSRQFSEISLIRKRRGDSKRASEDSFNLFKSTLKSHLETTIASSGRLKSNNTPTNLKRCLSQNGLEQNTLQINLIIQRSKKALIHLQSLRERMSSYRGFFEIIKSIHNQF